VGAKLSTWVASKVRNLFRLSELVPRMAEEKPRHPTGGSCGRRTKKKSNSKLVFFPQNEISRPTVFRKPS
jgi:hypothetical protein